MPLALPTIRSQFPALARDAIYLDDFRTGPDTCWSGLGPGAYRGHERLITK